MSERIKMKYLIRKHKPKTYHLWNEQLNDTECKMYSTGGLKQSKYQLVDESLIYLLFKCSMCDAVTKRG